MRNRVEVGRDIGVDHFGVVLPQGFVHLAHRLSGTAPGPIPIGRVIKLRLEDRLQHELAAACTTRSRIEGRTNGLSPLPLAFGIITRRTGWGR
jgi:hypothetical protein